MKPKKPKIFDRQIRFDLTSFDVQLLEQKAKAAGIKKAEYLRSMITNSQVIESDKEYQKRMMWLFLNATNNINQIAHHANIKKAIDYKVLKQIEELNKHLRNVLEAA